MRTLVYSTIILLLSAGCKNSTGPQIPSNVNTTEIIKTNKFGLGSVDSFFVKRIEEGIYDGYTSDLCIDDLNRCKLPEFEKYKQDSAYELKIQKNNWAGYPEIVKKEILNEIVYYTWGHPGKKYNSLAVTFPDKSSPFAFLSSKSMGMFMVFPPPEYLKGGKGTYAYGPNCWYMALSSIIDSSASFSKLNELTSSFIGKPRFLGPSEFRCFMRNFEKVDTPRFGDIVRYYTDSAYYNESINLYDGEVHAAVYIGKDTSSGIKDIVLTKNGRDDLSFLVFQDMKGLDELYLSKDKKDPRIKGYFRVKKGLRFDDPSICGPCSQCYEGYKIDSINYQGRWDCLAGKGSSGTCKGMDSCRCFPKEWKVMGF